MGGNADPHKADYEAGWDMYSDLWESSIRGAHIQNLGDEWGSPALTDESVDQYVRPYFASVARVLEIGCGSGKFSERLAPLCASLIGGDVAGKILERTKQRLQGLGNVGFEKLNGLELQQFETESIDFVFSFDYFVHIALEDTHCYLQEVRRVLRSGGRSLLHFTNLLELRILASKREQWRDILVVFCKLIVST